MIDHHFAEHEGSNTFRMSNSKNTDSETNQMNWTLKVSSYLYKLVFLLTGRLISCFYAYFRKLFKFTAKRLLFSFGHTLIKYDEKPTVSFFYVTICVTPNF